MIKEQENLKDVMAQITEAKAQLVTCLTSLKKKESAYLLPEFALFETLCASWRETFLKWGKEESFFLQIAHKLLVNMMESSQSVVTYSKSRSPLALSKLEFELIPLVRVLYMVVYYCGMVKGDSEKEAYFEKEEYPKLFYNTYTAESENTGNYKYDVSIMVLAYNQLDYTKKCVESILETLDPSLDYELILVNNGSSDGTKEYFQSIGCTKQLDFQENDLQFSFLSCYFIPQGKYICAITNDIILCKNSMANLLTCIQADPSHCYVVPSTSNMMNNQEPKFPEGCGSAEDMLHWAEGNNISSPSQWEHRVMLYNPVELCRSSELFGKNPLLRTPFFLSFVNHRDGTDNVRSVLTRRAGRKCILAKDAFCYHHDHVTRKASETFSDPTLLQINRATIEKATGIPAVPTGRCYSNTLINQFDFTGTDHKEVLGINCGLGANPLKVKESLKEISHNLDCYVTNIQENDAFALDLATLCDVFLIVENVSAFEIAISGKKYDYIIWEDPFTFAMDEVEELAVYQLLKNTLTDKGVLLLGQPTDSAKNFFTEHKMVQYINHSSTIDCLVFRR